MFEKLINGIIGMISNMALAIASKFFPAELYNHSINVSIPASAALNNQDFNIRLDYDIYVYGFGMSSTGAFSFQLKNSGGSVLYSNAQINNTSLISPTGIGPVFRLYRLWKIPAGSDILIDFTNLTAETNALQFVLCAFKGMPQSGKQDFSSQWTPNG